MTKSIWEIPENVEKLKSYWGEGIWAANIGQMMGVSKNAIIGKADRLGLPIRKHSHRHKDAPKPKARKPKPKADSKEPAFIFTEQYRCSIWGVNNNSCRFPLWVGDDLDKENLAPNIKPVLKYFGF